MVKKIQACNCGSIEGKKTILNSHVHVGITTKFSKTGTFIENTCLYLEQNYCPQCGRKYIVKEITYEED